MDRLFGRFDALVEAMGIHKLETIGDAYLCATNIVLEEGATHAIAMASFAIAAQQAAAETPVDPEDAALGAVQIRVGLSSGPCMASVVGQRNPKCAISHLILKRILFVFFFLSLRS